MVQVAAYRVEANLLGDDRIPALHESLDQLREVQLCWLGAFEEDDNLTGALAWTETAIEVDIERLVVSPDRHRRGIGKCLVRAALVHAGPRPTVVSTGRANIPARHLYQQAGFRSLGDAEEIPALWITHLEHVSEGDLG